MLSELKKCSDKLFVYLDKSGIFAAQYFKGVKITIFLKRSAGCTITKKVIMNGELTFAIIKPNAVRTGKSGPILAMINEAGFEISGMKMISLTVPQAEAFYDIHKGMPFFDGLVEFITSGPVIVMILRRENAVEEFRNLIGDTDPEKAEPGTIRKLYAVSVRMNAVHGSESDEYARREADFFFSNIERF